MAGLEGDDLARQDLGYQPGITDTPNDQRMVPRGTYPPAPERINVLPQKFIMHPDLPGGMHMWDRDDAADGSPYYHAEMADQLGLDRIDMYDSNSATRAGYVERRGDAWHPFPAYLHTLSPEDEAAVIAKANERTGLNWPAYQMEPLPELPADWGAPAPPPKTSADWASQMPQPEQIRGPEPDPGFYEGPPYEWTDEQAKIMGGRPLPQNLYYGDTDTQRHFKFLTPHTGEAVFGQNAWVWPVDGRDGFPWHMHKRDQINRQTGADIGSHTHTNGYGTVLPDGTHMLTDGELRYEQHHDALQDAMKAYGVKSISSADTRDPTDQDWEDAETWAAPSPPPPPGLDRPEAKTAAMTLYRGEGDHDRASYYPATGPNAQAGMWWTSDPQSASNYAASTTNGKLYKIDVEPHEVEQRGLPKYYLIRDPAVRARRVEAKLASPGEWDMSGDDPRWVQPHNELLEDALHSWKGDPSSMGIHMHDAMHDPEHVPSAGSGKQMRAQAEALLRELQENGKPNPVRLYRGSHVAPVGHQAWSENRATANLFAKKNGGQVHTLEPGQGRGIRIADYIKSGADENEQEWIIDHGQRTAKTAMPVGPMPDNITYKLLGSPERQQCLYADTPEFLEQRMHAAYICWYSDGEIKNIYVQPELRRLGLATELLNRAREINPNVHHSDQLSEDAQGWSQAVAKTANPYANEAPWFINKQGQLIVGGWGQLHEDIGGSPDTIQSKGTVSKSGAVTVFGYYTDDWSPIIDKEAIYREVAPQLAQQLGIKPYPTGEEQNAEENLGNYDFSPPPAPKQAHEDKHHPKHKHLVDRVFNEGGFTVDPDLNEAPTDGYYVSQSGGDVIPADDFSADDIARKQGEVEPGQYIGAWLDDGHVYLDTTHRFDDLADANDFGAHHSQQALWDANDNQVLPVVARPKTRSEMGDDWTVTSATGGIVPLDYYPGRQREPEFRCPSCRDQGPNYMLEEHAPYFSCGSCGDVSPLADAEPAASPAWAGRHVGIYHGPTDTLYTAPEAEHHGFITSHPDFPHDGDAEYNDLTRLEHEDGRWRIIGMDQTQPMLDKMRQVFNDPIMGVDETPKSGPPEYYDWTNPARPTMSKTAYDWSVPVDDVLEAPWLIDHTGQAHVGDWGQGHDEIEGNPELAQTFGMGKGHVTKDGRVIVYDQETPATADAAVNHISDAVHARHPSIPELTNATDWYSNEGDVSQRINDHPWLRSAAYDSDPKMQQFFQDAGQGLRAPNRPLGPEDLPMSPDAQAFRQVWEQYAGPFDQHIETSIPGYAQNMAAKGVALTKAFPGSSVLDMAAGHGSFGKALAAHGMQTTNVDAAPHFRDSFEANPVPGAQFAQNSLSGEGFTDANGNDIEPYPEGNTHDVVHEAMGFQFYSQDRERDVAQAKAHLNPGGLAIFDEKFTQTDPSLEQSNEATKDQWKLKHYPQADLDAKAQEVGLNDQWSTGMRSMQANQDDFEKVLARNFRFVKPYWKNGNFAGYAASDNPHTLTKYLDAYSQAAQAPSKAPESDSQPHAASSGTTPSDWHVTAENGSEWPTLDQLHRPWADDHGYEPLDADGDWLMGGGCAHLALAMKSMWPEGKIASSWYDDHGDHALAHAAFYDPKSGHAWDGAGAHKYADVAISGHSGETERNMDTDPAVLAEHMGINYNPKSPFEDDNVNDAAEFANRHFNPSYTPPEDDDEWLAHTSAEFDFSKPLAPGDNSSGIDHGDWDWRKEVPEHMPEGPNEYSQYWDDRLPYLIGNNGKVMLGKFGGMHEALKPGFSGGAYFFPNVAVRGAIYPRNGQFVHVIYTNRSINPMQGDTPEQDAATKEKIRMKVEKAFGHPLVHHDEDQVEGRPDYSDSSWADKFPGEYKEPKLGHTKTAMPYHNNTWYHVTPQSYLPSIAERGLVPQTMGSSQQNWQNIPQDEKAVYLHQNFLSAQEMANRSQAVRGAGQGNPIPNWPMIDGKPDKPAILRITGIDRNQVVPDPESFQHTMEGWGEQKKWGEDGGEMTPAAQHYMQDFDPDQHDYFETDIPEAIHTVRDMHERFPDEMRDLAESHADDEGNPMMTLGGPVHPDNIEHVHMPTWEDWMDDFQPSDSAQRRIEHRDDYDMHDEEQRDWMDDNDYNSPPGDEAMMDDMEGDPADMAGDDYADYLRATPLRDYVKRRWPHTAGAREDFAGVPGWASVPKHVYNWLDQMYPDEQHGYESDCINPKCQHNWTDTERRELAQYGQVRCPECKLEQNREGTVGPWYDEAHMPPGQGGTHSGLTRTQQGDIGEQIVKRLGQLPSGPITEHYRDSHYNHPFDFRTEDEHGQPWAIEVKTNHSQTGPRFKWGGREEIEAKRNFAAQNGMRPALAGVRLNYFTNKADVFFRPQITDPYMSPQTMTHVGSVDFSDLNPFHDPASGQTNVPEMPVAAGAEDLPF